MKMILASILFSLSVHASSVFKSDTRLPLELQNKVLQAVYTCGDYTRSWSLQEENTSVSEIRVDQGVIDYRFETIFSVNYYFDGTHPMTKKIGVVSMEWDIDNPAAEKWTVESLDCPNL
ncbi:MAG: hypothetical protein K2P81_05585 [Bacteriovoracaceae bacterium]|nr:hypothetical protein [Bacteriovoracaceae bacterium]